MLDRPDREIQSLDFSLGAEHPAYSALPADVRESRPSVCYIRVPDLVAFLRHVQPALEKHLIGTAAEGHNGELKLNFSQSGIHFTFESGKIMDISNWLPESSEVGDACLRNSTFLQLICGQRRFKDLALDSDCQGTDEAAILLDCLFPRFTGRLWTFA